MLPVAFLERIVSGMKTGGSTTAKEPRLLGEVAARTTRGGRRRHRAASVVSAATEPASAGRRGARA